ncbi:hypothetical protein JZ751_013843 [Albula glossodonta]|uniref:Uncharacterized protein n=1 Tax=Albula glossodonta TaxID=121402 RepID=A0A8T2N5H0_9TELE|nr:hypothetical protein JZ751_013843 [Albula glossodonta]
MEAERRTSLLQGTPTSTHTDSRAGGGLMDFTHTRVRLEEGERRAQHTIEQLQREQRHLQRRLEQLGVERTRMDSTGSPLSSEKSDSDQEELDVDVEGTDYLLGDLEWSTSSVSDWDERGSLRSSCSDEGYSSASLLRLTGPQDTSVALTCSL